MESHIGKHLVNHGKIMIKPDDSVYLVWNKWLKENHPEEHHKARYNNRHLNKMLSIEYLDI